MSVAASLANLRHTNAPQKPSSLLHSPALAARITRAEQAATAHNALQLLQTIDPHLQTLQPSLLLNELTQNRETLPPSDEAALRTAVVSVVRRLAPVFPLRHTQAVFEWLVAALHIGSLGSDPEIDAICIAALPFHATSHFPRLARVVQNPGPKWRWLKPIAEAAKPVDVSYLVACTPPQVLLDVVDVAVESALLGISTTPIAGFIANVVARRLAQTPHRNLALHCVSGLSRLIQHLKKSSSTGFKHVENVICALFTSVSAAVVAGVDVDVCPAAVQAAVLLLVSSRPTTSVSDTAIACLVLICAHHPSALSRTNAHHLVSADVLSSVLPRLNKPAVAKMFLRNVIISLIGEDLPKPKRFASLQKILSPKTPFLTPETTTAAIAKLFDVLSRVTGIEKGVVLEPSFKQGLIEKLVDILAPLARGQFAEAVDKALRLHFNARSHKKSERSRYSLVDDALALALRGTQYEVLKKDAMAGRNVTGCSLVSMMTHPELSVRKALLNRIVQDGALRTSLEKSAVESLCSSLMALIESESIMEIVALSVDCALLFRNGVNLGDLFGIAARRYIDFQNKPQYKKRKARTRGNLALIPRLLCVGEHCEEERLSAVQAWFLGVLIMGLVPESLTDVHKDQLRKFLGRKGSPLKLTFSKKGKAGASFRVETERAVTRLIGTKDFNVKMFCDQVCFWEPSWSFQFMSLWVKHVSENVALSQEEIPLTNVIHQLVSLYEQNEKLRVPVVDLVVSHFMIFCSGPASLSIRRNRFKCLWAMLSLSKNDQAIQELLRVTVEHIGMADVLLVLRQACMESTKHENGRSCSMRWYVNICLVHPLEDVRRDAVLFLLSAMYGDDDSLRSEVIRICGRRCNVFTEKYESKTELWTVMAMIVRIGNKTVNGNNTKMLASRTIVVDELLAEAFPLLELSNKLPNPLACGSDSSGHFADISKTLLSALTSKEPSFYEKLYILRAMEGLCYSLQAEQEQLFSFLQSQLGSIESLDSCPERVVEIIARSTILLIPSLNLGVETRVLVSFSKLVLPLLQSGSLREKPLPPVIHIVLLALATHLIMLCSSVGSRALQNVIRNLLMPIIITSGKSSKAGLSAGRLLDSIMGSCVSIEEVVPFLNDLSLKFKPNSKRRRVSIPKDDQTLLRRNELGLGSIEGLRRWVASKNSHAALSLRAVKVSLWNLLSLSAKTPNDERQLCTDEAKYELVSVLDTLTAVHRRDPVPGDGVPFEDMDSLISVVFYESTEEEKSLQESPLVLAVRRSALALVEELAPTYGAQLQYVIAPVIESLISSNATKRSLSSLKRVIPALLKAGCEFKKVCSWLCNALLDERKSCSLQEKRSMLASCCHLVPDVETAVQTCIQEICSRMENRGKISDAARECSLLLLEIDLTVCGDLRVLASAGKKIQCSMVANYLLHPSFVTKLFTFMSAASQGEDKEALSTISVLFQSMLESTDEKERSKAIRPLLAILPLPALSMCMTNALYQDDLTVQYNALHSLCDILEATDVPIMHKWDSDVTSTVFSSEEIKIIEEEFMQRVGSLICSLILKRAVKVHLPDVRVAAVQALEKISSRFGSSSYGTIVKFSESLWKILDSGLTANVVSFLEGKEAHCVLLSSTLHCMASIITILGKNAVPFIPKCLDVSTSVFKEYFGSSILEKSQVSKKNMRLIVSLTESAVEVCSAILESCPKFFGRKTVQEVATLTVATNAEVLRDLLKLIVERIPSITMVLAMSSVIKRLEKSNANSGGICLLLDCIKIGVESMRKSELKVHCDNLLLLTLQCVEFCRNSDIMDIDFEQEDEGMNGHTRNESSDGEKQVDKQDELISGCHAVDESCAATITTMVLRLPESSFKRLFDTMVQWCDNGSLPPIAVESCEAFAIVVESHLLRALPFFKILLHVFEHLQSIFVPYFFQLLEKVVAIISLRRSRFSKDAIASKLDETAGTMKKRTRSTMEVDMHRKVCLRLSIMQEMVIDVCLDNLGVLMKQKLDGHLFSSSAAKIIQEGLLTSFDEVDGSSEKVSRVFCAFATRIVAVGNWKDNKEESRELLKGLGRSLLSRTGESRATLRAGALNVSRMVALTVGDEYLVTLPEAMPVLAEVIDDEDSTVQKAAKDFVKVMETLTGESILDQIK